MSPLMAEKPKRPKQAPVPPDIQCVALGLAESLANWVAKDASLDERDTALLRKRMTREAKRLLGI